MNPLLAKSHQIVTVRVEYDARNGERVVKEFTGDTSVSASRSFYRAKLRAGKNPRVVGASRVGD